MNPKYNPSTKEDSIRNISTIITYPPGSIHELPDKTVMILGPDFWKNNNTPNGYKKIEDYRLQKRLNVKFFLEPPNAEAKDPNDEYGHSYYIPSQVFPDLHICSECNELFSYYNTKKILQNKWDDLEYKIKKFNFKNKKDLKLYPPPYISCPYCSLKDVENWDIDGIENKVKIISKIFIKSVSINWIYICKEGHIGDIPIDYMVQHNLGCQKSRYKFEVKYGSVDLKNQYIVCRDCKEKISIQQIYNNSHFIKCQGKTPWKWNNKETKCNPEPDSKPNVTISLKGDSMVCIPNVISSLQIPPYNLFPEIEEHIQLLPKDRKDDFEFKVLEYQTLCKDGASNIEAQNKLDEIANFIYKNIKEKIDLPESELKNGIKKYIEKSSEDLVLKTEFDYRYNEYICFYNGNAQKQRIEKNKFEIRTQKEDPLLQKLPFRDVVIADQLTITLTTETISRVESKVFDQENAKEISIKSGNIDWLPAVEVKGEGIFIDFKKELLDQWYQENSTYFKKHLRKIKKNYIVEFNDTEGTAKFLLLHSFAHYFINAMSFVCGYNSASLRERIYYSTLPDSQMSAVLIATSAGDSESSMGGLAYYGKLKQFSEILKNTIYQLKVCSNDPICGESKPEIDKPLNFAACFSCILLPETSCEFANKFLDRNCLVGEGDGKTSVNGFFEMFTV